MNCCALEQHQKMIKCSSQEGVAWLITIKATGKNMLGTVHKVRQAFHHGWQHACKAILMMYYATHLLHDKCEFIEVTYKGDFSKYAGKSFSFSPTN